MTIPDIFIKLIDVVEIEGTKLFKIDLFQINNNKRDFIYSNQESISLKERAEKDWLIIDTGDLEIDGHESLQSK